MNRVAKVKMTHADAYRQGGICKTSQAATTGAAVSLMPINTEGQGPGASYITRNTFPEGTGFLSHSTDTAPRGYCRSHWNWMHPVSDDHTEQTIRYFRGT